MTANAADVATAMQRQGLYDPSYEHDGCGIGFVAHVKGERSPEIVRGALELLEWHRLFKPLPVIIAIVLIAYRTHSSGARGRFDACLMLALAASLAGDVFLIITDGLTEVFRRDGREFGMDGVRAAFDGGTDSPEELTERVLAGAARYGRQLDDQTVLAVRLAAD